MGKKVEQGCEHERAEEIEEGRVSEMGGSAARGRRSEAELWMHGAGGRAGSGGGDGEDGRK